MELVAANEVYNPIYLGCQDSFPRESFRFTRSRKTGKTYICPQLRDGATDGELAEVHHHPAQKQEQWKPGLGEDQAYRRDEDRSDVGRMENGTYHYPLIWDNGTLVKSFPPGVRRCMHHGLPFADQSQWRLSMEKPGANEPNTGFQANDGLTGYYE